MTDTLEQAALLLRKHVGLLAGTSAMARIKRLLEEGAAGAGMPVEAYFHLVEAEPEVFGELLDRVTVQHSDFFRDPAQLAALAQLARGVQGPRVTVWSAGCGNGQEPYSLAMLLDETGHQDWRILATDVSRRALARTVTGRYTASEVRGLSPERRKRYLVEGTSGFEVTAELRSRVLAVHHNLAQKAAPPILDSTFVLCRNVLMYFDPKETEASIHRLAGWMKPGGYLFLGHSDTAKRVHPPFEAMSVAGTHVHRLPAAAGTVAAPARQRVQSLRSTPDVSGLMARGGTATAGGDLRAAIHAFRQATYLDPDLTVAYFQLGAALELAGDRREARRAFGAAGLSLMRSEERSENIDLEGYTGRDLARAIAIKLTGSEV
jgi:chemotaxis methyl-accepting protein methylase